MKTPTLARRLAATLAGLLLAATAATAQTAPPAWSSVRAIGQATVVSTAIDAAGNLYQAGTFVSDNTIGPLLLTSQGMTDGYLAKFDPTGSLIWVRQIGSFKADGASGVALDAAGNAYLTGYFGGACTLGNGLALYHENTAARSTFVIRYSPQGLPEWVQQSTSTATDETSQGTSIAVDAIGNVYVTGLLTKAITLGGVTLPAPSSSSANPSVYLARFNTSTGSLDFLTPAFAHKPLNSLVSYSPIITVSPAGAIYLVTNFTESLQLANGSTLTSLGGGVDVAVLRYAASGRLEWSRKYGSYSQDQVTHAISDAVGNLYVCGVSLGGITAGTVTLPGIGKTDSYLLKYDASGTVQWGQELGGEGFDAFVNITLDAAGAPYVTGYFSQTLVAGAQTLTSAGQLDVLVAAYSPQGQLRWVQQAGGPEFDYGTALGVAPNGNIYVHGYTNGPISFGPFTLPTPLNNKTFIARLGSAVLSTGTARPLALGLAPNPATGRVRLSGLPAGRPVNVFDQLGRLVRTAALAPDASFSVQGLTPGLYLVRAVDAQNQPYAGRLVVE